MRIGNSFPIPISWIELGPCVLKEGGFKSWINSNFKISCWVRKELFLNLPNLSPIFGYTEFKFWISPF